MTSAQRGQRNIRTAASYQRAAVPSRSNAVGDAGADGIFGLATGDAVSEYKRSKGLEPDDPVVGVGTSTALDDDLFVDPPTLDPAFAEFAPAVVEHRDRPA